LTSGEHIRLEELELFALGALPEDEAAALQAHVSGCEECSANLAVARGDAALLAFAVKQDAPAGTIKAELMARIRANQEAEKRVAWPAKPAETDRDVAGRKPALGSSWWNWVLVPAALALALISFALSWQNRRIAETAPGCGSDGSRPRADRETGGRAGFAGYGDGEIGRNKRSGKRQWRGEIQCEDRDCAVLGGLAGAAEG
jgi:hypothetical protein